MLSRSLLRNAAALTGIATIYSVARTDGDHSTRVASADAPWRLVLRQSNWKQLHQQYVFNPMESVFQRVANFQDFDHDATLQTTMQTATENDFRVASSKVQRGVEELRQNTMLVDVEHVVDSSTDGARVSTWSYSTVVEKQLFHTKHVVVFKDGSMCRLNATYPANVDFSPWEALECEPATPSFEDVFDFGNWLFKTGFRAKQAALKERALRHAAETLEKCVQDDICDAVSSSNASNSTPDRRLADAPSTNLPTPNTPDPTAAKCRVACNNLGIAFAELGLYPDALAVLRGCAQKYPSHAKTWYNLACGFAQNKEKEQMLGALQRAFELDSKGDDVSSATWRQLPNPQHDDSFSTYHGDADFINLVESSAEQTV